MKYCMKYRHVAGLMADPRAESARNPIALHVKFGDDSALSAFTRTQWTAAFKGTNPALKKPSNIPEIYAKMFGRFH